MRPSRSHALEYLERLLADAALPADVKDLIDFELGKTLIDEASKSNDRVCREELLKESPTQLETFATTHPQLSQARDALVDLAKLLIERGHLAMLLRKRPPTRRRKTPRSPRPVPPLSKHTRRTPRLSIR